jgi:hypothetical protein
LQVVCKDWSIPEVEPDLSLADQVKENEALVGDADDCAHTICHNAIDDYMYS